MPLLSENIHPANIVAKQKSVFEKKGYHLIFDNPLKFTNWERNLPCKVQGGLSVHVFLYQRRPMGQYGWFRYCINHYGRRPYVELGQFPHHKGHIRITVNGTSIASRVENDIPKIGSYFWIEFNFTGTKTFKGYYMDRLIGESETTFEQLLYFYSHADLHSSSDILSLHFTRSDGRSPIEGNIPYTNLNFTTATSRIYARGTYTGKKGDGKIKMSVLEHGNQASTKTEFEIDPGNKRPDMITIHVMSFLIKAFAGDGHVVAKTKVLAGDREKPCVVQVWKNFTVDSVIIHTGMFDESGNGPGRAPDPK
ncbi:uncharacterized protein LOC144107023 [Amblyomma americanum]